jgi:hypothetical protein
MSRNAIASFSLKILGIVCIVLAISSLESLMAYVIFTISESKPVHIELTYVLLYAGIPFAILVAGGILLLMNSDSWGEKFWRDKEKETTEPGLSKDERQMLGFSLLGLLVLAFAIPKLFKILITWMGTMAGSGNPAYSSYVIKDIIFILIQLSIGVYLFIGSTGLNKLWKQIQKTRG